MAIYQNPSVNQHPAVNRSIHESANALINLLNQPCFIYKGHPTNNVPHIPTITSMVPNLALALAAHLDVRRNEKQRLIRNQIGKVPASQNPGQGTAPALMRWWEGTSSNNVQLLVATRKLSI